MQTIVTAQQLRSRVAHPEALLIEPGGVVLPVADGTVIGRGAVCDVAVLHASVSVLHARISRYGGRWWVLDLGSRNGTFVDGLPARPRAALEPGARVELGDVTFCFWPSPGGFALALAGGAGAIELVDGGVRAGHRFVSLSPREHALLERLVARRVLADDPELAYVPSTEIAEALGFASIEADGDNVRELVHRLRRKLMTAGLGDAVKSRRGAGYRLNGDVVAPAIEKLAA
jgi:hypothetical protein